MTGGRPSTRALRDVELKVEIERVHKANYQVYGPRKVWLALNREGIGVARCTVERLMRELGLAGACRGKRWKTPRRMAGLRDRRTSSIASSRRPHRIGVGR